MESFMIVGPYLVRDLVAIDEDLLQRERLLEVSSKYNGALDKKPIQKRSLQPY